jgi:hypothetical protein
MELSVDEWRGAFVRRIKRKAPPSERYRYAHGCLEEKEYHVTISDLHRK